MLPEHGLVNNEPTNGCVLYVAVSLIIIHGLGLVKIRPLNGCVLYCCDLNLGFISRVIVHMSFADIINLQKLQKLH